MASSSKSPAGSPVWLLIACFALIGFTYKFLDRDSDRPADRSSPSQANSQHQQTKPSTEKPARPAKAIPSAPVREVVRIRLYYEPIDGVPVNPGPARSVKINDKAVNLPPYTEIPGWKILNAERGWWYIDETVTVNEAVTSVTVQLSATAKNRKVRCQVAVEGRGEEVDHKKTGAVTCNWSP